MRSGLLAAAALAIALAGCQASLEDLAPKENAPLPAHLVQTMKAKGMTRQSPIMVRVFKEEGKLEVWKQKDTGRYDLVTSYDICKWSGKLGPKFVEGDRQAPEGFYTVNPWQMNPKSNYYLAFNIGYPNAYDRHHGRTGSHLMVHGACSSAGCYSMTDEQIREIYAFARDAFKGGQTEFQIQAFPFRMTPENMARYKDDRNFKFWQMLKEGYDHFEITRIPPKVDVCQGRYVFNGVAEGARFSAGACAAAEPPESLLTAYTSRLSTQNDAFTEALSRSNLKPPTASIQGVEEAILVAKWSAARARGEKVSAQPPSLATPATAIAASPAPAPEAAPVATAFAPAEQEAAAEILAEPAAEDSRKKRPWWNPFK